MIIPDVNLLLHAYNKDFPGHSEARSWWEEAVNRRQIIGMPWVVLLGFIRIITNPRIMEHPMKADEALLVAESWVDLPNVEMIEPGPNHIAILARLIRAAGVAGNLTTDAHLAAIAIENQSTLFSSDVEFGRFEGLRWVNPLSRKGG